MIGDGDGGDDVPNVHQFGLYELGVKEWIIYVVVPVVVVIGLIGLIVYFCFYRKRQRDKELHLIGEPSHDLLSESDIIEDISEVQPLNTTAMMAKINNVDVYDGYGATAE